MIASFGSKATEDLFNGLDSKAARTIPKNLWTVAVRKLTMLNAAQNLQDLKAPPSNHLEALKGDLKGKYSIRVNEKYRVVFAFAAGAATAVQVMDYH